MTESQNTGHRPLQNRRPALTERQMASSSGAIHRPFDFVLGGGAVHESGLLEIRRSGSNFTRLTEPCGPWCGVRGPAGPAEVEVFGSRRASEALQELCHEMVGINLSCSAHNASTCPEIPRTVEILLPIYSRVTIIITGKKVRGFASAVDVNLGKFR